jgi:hypothetical protein
MLECKSIPTTNSAWNGIEAIFVRPGLSIRVEVGRLRVYGGGDFLTIESFGGGWILHVGGEDLCVGFALFA